MRDQELEQHLRTAVEHAAPDPLERILSSCDTQKGTVIPMTNNPKKKTRWASLAVAAALAVMLCGGFGLHGWQTAHAVASVVSLDVNPSIQLQVNQKEKVLSAEAMNTDAEAILEGMDLKGTQLNVAVNAIVGSLLQHGYLDSLSSAILISVEDNDAQRASRLETSLTEEVNAALQNAAAGASVLSQTIACDAELENEAASNSVSVGKAALIQQVQGLNSSLTFSDLAKLTVEELKEMRETGASALPVGTSAAISAAMEYAGLSGTDVLDTDADPELDERTPHYEVELKTSYGKYEYMIDAYTGEVLSGPADVTPPASADKNASTASSAAIITESQAQSIALNHAGVAAGDALGLQVKLDREDGVQVYEIEFRANGIKYEYEIAAADGAIRKAEQDGHSVTQTSSGTSSGTSGNAAASYIGEAAAKNAALSHAGVAISSTYYCNAWLDYENGKPDHYEVEFKVGSVRYEYEIGLYDGSVLDYEREDTGSGKVSGSEAKSSAGTASLIGEDAAKNAAFAHAGVSASNVSKLECELHEEDGSYRYQVEFQVGGTEYEYEINAATGAVVKFESEAHDK